MKRILLMMLFFVSVPAKADVFFSLTRDAASLSDTPNDVVVIKSADIEKTNAKTVADAVEELPGVQITKSGSFGAAEFPSMRGFSSKQLAVVLDDVLQSPDLTGTIDLSRIPLDDVDRIEIIRGGSSVIYGPNAEGGVIHIITKKPVSKIQVQATSEAGSYETYHNQLQVGSAQGPLQLQVTGSRDLTDGFQQNSDYRNTGLSGFASYNVDKFGKLSFNVVGSRGTLGLPSGTPVPMGQWNGERERQANDLVSRQSEDDRAYKLEHVIAPLSWLELTSRIANNVIYRDVFEYGMDTVIRTEGRNALLKAKINDSNSLGYEYYQRRLDSNTYGVHRGDAWGVYGETIQKPTEVITVIPGLRYDRDNTYGESWSPRLVVVDKIKEIWKISATTSRSFQAPTFADLYDPFVPPAFVAPHLNPEVTWSYDLGVSMAMPHLETSVTFYRSDTRDRIALDPNKGFAAYNLGRAYSQGVESELKFQWLSMTHGINWTYLQALGQNPGENFRSLQFNPRHILNYRMDWNGFWQSRCILRVRYVHNQWTGIGETGVKIPGYTTVGIRTAKTIGFAEVFVGIENLFDRHYAQTADSFSGYFPQPGRTINGGLTIRFWE